MFNNNHPNIMNKNVRMTNNHRNCFIHLEYFHNFVTDRGYFEVTINPVFAPKNENKLIQQVIGDRYFTVTLEQNYRTYVKELCKRSPVSQKKIEKQIEKVHEQAKLKAYDLMMYFLHRLTTYDLNDVVNVTYSLASDWKNIKIASHDLLKSAV